MAVSIACGSYADPEYADLLYPRGLSPDLRLSAYAMWLDCLEVNASYYQVPKPPTVAKWIQCTPPAFRFNLRVHRVISQSPLKSAQDGRLIGYFLENLRPLAEAGKLGALLLVLPPTFSPPRHQLDELDLLLEKFRPQPVAIELRNRAWIEGSAKSATLSWFRQRGVTWVAVDMPRIAGSELMPPLDEVTQPGLAYLRLHGRSANWTPGKSAAEKHEYAYSSLELDEIILRIGSLAKKATNVCVVANNHAHDFAPRTALALKERLGLF